MIVSQIFPVCKYATEEPTVIPKISRYQKNIMQFDLADIAQPCYNSVLQIVLRLGFSDGACVTSGNIEQHVPLTVFNPIREVHLFLCSFLCFMCLFVFFRCSLYFSPQITSWGEKTSDVCLL